MAKRITTNPAPVTDADGYTVAQPVGAAVQGHRLPLIPGRDVPFYMAHHPRSWELVEGENGWELLPTLKTLRARPGVGLVEQSKSQGGEPDTGRMRTKAGDQGFKVLDLNEYLVSIPAQGGPAYFLKWERVRTWPDGDWEMDMDQDGFDAWRRSLVADGRIAPPRDSVVSTLRRRLTRRLGRLDAHLHLPKAVRVKDETSEALEGLEAIKPSKAKRKPARSRKPKAPAKPSAIELEGSEGKHDRQR